MGKLAPITHQHAIDALRQAVNEKGRSWVYQKPPHSTFCLYWHGDAETGRPGCIVGTALHKLGVPAHFLAKHAETIVTELPILSGRRRLTRGAQQVFRAAQSAQDKGFTWGEALQDAEEKYNDITAYGGELNER